MENEELTDKILCAILEWNKIRNAFYELSDEKQEEFKNDILKVVSTP